MPQTLQANHAQDYVICVHPKRFAARTYFYPIPQDISDCFLDCKALNQKSRGYHPLLFTQYFWPLCRISHVL